jgi:hypothetical protein
MTGTMTQAAQSLLSAILALLPSPHLRDSLKALLFLLLQGHGKARPQHSQTKSPSALSRFLNSCPWPIRAPGQGKVPLTPLWIPHNRRGGKTPLPQEDPSL